MWQTTLEAFQAAISFRIGLYVIVEEAGLLSQLITVMESPSIHACPAPSLGTISWTPIQAAISSATGTEECNRSLPPLESFFLHHFEWQIQPLLGFSRQMHPSSPLKSQRGEAATSLPWIKKVHACCKPLPQCINGVSKELWCCRSSNSIRWTQVFLLVAEEWWI